MRQKRIEKMAPTVTNSPELISTPHEKGPSKKVTAPAAAMTQPGMNAAARNHGIGPRVSG